MGRSIDLFMGNAIIGILYSVSYFDSYIYAAITAFAAFAITLYITATRGSIV